ncbi:MAG: TlpA family protein disulfide reductase [Cryomorphaceae bacterium]|nr:TlpA family protein disulfide reductase [Cryomorphaceae bacterium]
MKKVILPVLILFFAITACEVSNETAKSRTDDVIRYKGLLTLNDSAQIPIIFYYGSNALTLHNSTEKIEMIPAEMQNDSIRWDFPVFNSSLLFVETQNGHISGYFLDHDKGYAHRLPFSATPSNEPRFVVESSVCCSINHPWEVVLRYDGEKPRHALGEFFQKESAVTGSIITQTGDYRFLEGIMADNNLTLVTFDGKFAYYFTAKLDDQEFKGHYFAGKSEPILWKASRNDTFELPSSTSLTNLKSEYKTFSFSIPDKNGNIVSPKEGKVNLIQILGSWCPNCMDEARVLEKWYNEYNKAGLEVIGLAFEYSDNPEAGWRAVNKMKADLNLSYPIVFAGKASPESTEKVLPMLNKVMAYPTLIIIDRTGNVRQIKTGFKGPGTSYFQGYKKEMEALLNELLYE